MLVGALVPLTAPAASAEPVRTVVDSVSTDITYDGSWRTMSSSADEGGSVRFLYSTGSASLDFTGTSIALLTRLTSSSGRSAVHIDGELVATVDGYSPTTKYGHTIFTSDALAPGQHTITVTRTGSRDPRSTGTNLIVDSFAVTGDAAVAPAADEPVVAEPIVEAEPVIAEEPTAVAPTATATVSAGTHENTSSAVGYSGAWRVMSSGSDSGKSSQYLNSPGSASLTFTGTAVRWLSRTTPSSGIADVYLDGVKVASVDRYSASTAYRKVVFERAGLANTTHTLKIQWTGDANPASSGKNLLLDAFVVLNAPASATAPATAAPDSPRYANCPVPTVTVTNAEDLMRAVATARPGDVVKMAAGAYNGQVNLRANGTAAEPIWVCGPRDAVVNTGSIRDGHGIIVSDSSHLIVAGMTVTNGLKGITVRTSDSVTIADTLVQSVGYEGIHLRENTTDSTVIGNVVRKTGALNPFYGEGIYIGSSETSWCKLTACQPDRSDRNSILANTISLTGSQPIEAKEGTTAGIVRGNTFDGTGAMSQAKSWVKVKGNDWSVTGNTGTGSSVHGFEVNGSVPGWGLRTTFAGNVAKVNASGYGFDLYERNGRGTSGTIVSCGNTVTGAASGFANVLCTP